MKLVCVGEAGERTFHLSIATPSEHLPIDFELYLPKSWTEDAYRRREARIPDAITFKTKIELAIEMVRRAARAGIPGEVLLADSFYGRSWELREAVRELGMDYAVAQPGNDRPSKWSKPSSPLRSSYARSVRHRSLVSRTICFLLSRLGKLVSTNLVGSSSPSSRSSINHNGSRSGGSRPSSCKALTRRKQNKEESSDFEP